MAVLLGVLFWLICAFLCTGLVYLIGEEKPTWGGVALFVLLGPFILATLLICLFCEILAQVVLSLKE